MQPQTVALIVKGAIIVVSLLIIKWPQIRDKTAHSFSLLRTKLAAPQPVVAPLQPDPSTVPGLALYRMLSATLERCMIEKRPDVARELVTPLMLVVPGTDFGDKDCAPHAK